MSNVLNCTVNYDFSLAEFLERVEGALNAQGISCVGNMVNANMCILDCDYGTGGFTGSVLGLGKSTTVQVTINGTNLTVSHSGGDWMGKVVAFIVGWFVCGITFITGLVGVVGQCNFPNEINRNILTVVASMNNNGSMYGNGMV